MNTTNKASNGEKIKASIKGLSQDEISQRAKALAPFIREKAAGPDSHDNDTLQYLASELNCLTDKGRLDLEYYADACDCLQNALKDKDYGREFMASLPKHTRQNIEEWLGRWRELFYSLYCYERTRALIDYDIISYPGGGFTEEDLRALEDQYKAKV